MVGIKSGIPRRTKTFIFKCTREEHRHFLELSHAMGLTVSELCRQLLAQEYARAVIGVAIKNLEVQNDEVVTTGC
jgi:hypothetical protein